MAQKARLIKRGTAAAEPQAPKAQPAAQPRTKTPAQLREQWQREQREREQRQQGRSAFNGLFRG